ncbi:cobalamin B12-binding domain-containing protein [Halobacteriales archaeon Cl-PHB]
MSSTQEDDWSRAIRVLIGKPGLDGHDRGAKVVARAFRDAGCEVIYSGLRNSPEAIVQTAIQEDVDVLGLSILSGAHDSLVPKVMDQLEEAGMTDVLVLVGGTIPDDDKQELLELGVDQVFGPDSDINEIVDYVQDELNE